MQDYNIVYLGDERLRVISKEIKPEEFGSNYLKELSKNLHHIMKEESGVGLAAPQIGISKRVFVMGFDKSEIRPDEPPIEFTCVINPNYKTVSTHTEEGYEGYLSVKGRLLGMVPRYNEIIFTYFDENGSCHTEEINGLKSRIVQHEIDHLDGIVFVDRVADTKKYA